ncbi:hypothetical protein VNO78_00146 [Psophocarpus tetragonolobus]|uniref:Uncharacterized protein n=1 Tax=Psophocarpus tetragonolobus TaxID=3891 RepID=A0AAN9SY59_PSOTE
MAPLRPEGMKILLGDSLNLLTSATATCHAIWDPHFSLLLQLLFLYLHSPTPNSLSFLSFPFLFLSLLSSL